MEVCRQEVTNVAEKSNAQFHGFKTVVASAFAGKNQQSGSKVSSTSDATLLFAQAGLEIGAGDQPTQLPIAGYTWLESRTHMNTTVRKRGNPEHPPTQNAFHAIQDLPRGASRENRSSAYGFQSNVVMNGDPSQRTENAPSKARNENALVSHVLTRA